MYSFCNLRVLPGIMMEDRKRLLKHLDRERDRITEQFLDTVEDLLTLILTHKKKFLKQLNEMHEQHVVTISEQMKRCSMVQNQAAALLENLKVRVF